MGQVTVRRVRPEDAARVKAIRLEMLVDSPLAFLERIDEAAALPHAEYRARIAQRAMDPDNAQFIAEEDGRIVGHAGGRGRPGDPRTTAIFAGFVTPGRRGAGILQPTLDGLPQGARQQRRPP